MAPTQTLAQANVPLTMETFADLASLISSLQIKTVEQLISALPEKFCRGYSLIYQSRALQRELVSPLSPRVLMFGQTGNLLLKYLGSNTQQIETLEFDQSAKKYFLREVVFNGTSVPDFNQVAANPSKCTRCHSEGVGGEVKLLWDSYNMCPGTYGSLSREGFDFIRSGSREGNVFLQFLNSVKSTHPRYSSLPELDLLNGESGVRKTLADFGRSSRRYSDPKTMDTDILLGDGWSLLPNQHISMIAAHHRFEMLARQLLQLPVAEQTAAQYLIRGLSEGAPVEMQGAPDISAFNQFASKASGDSVVWYAEPLCWANLADFFRVSGQRALRSRRLSKRSTA